MPRALEFRQISSDALKSWKKCRKKFYYKYVKGLSWPEDQSNFRLGKDVHKLLDYQARGLDCTLLLDHAPQDVRISWEKLMAHPITHLPVVANEWAFHVPMPLPMSLGNGRTEWLTGRIDRVARSGDQILVIDWKTGTGIPRAPEQDWQTLLYLYALVEVADTPSAADLGLQGLRPEQVQFTYVEVKADNGSPVRLVEIPYDSDKHESVRQLIGAVLSDMAVEEDYPITNPCPDRFCAYRTICGIE